MWLTSCSNLTVLQDCFTIFFKTKAKVIITVVYIRIFIYSMKSKKSFEYCIILLSKR